MMKSNFNYSNKKALIIFNLIIVIIVFIPFVKVFAQQNTNESPVSDSAMNSPSIENQDPEVVARPESAPTSESSISPVGPQNLEETLTNELPVPVFRREDPFEPPKSFLRVAPQNIGTEASKKNASDLEKYDVADFTLVGLLWNVKKPKALVKIPNGTVHIVYKKTKLGLYGGYVSDFSEGAVEVVEYLVNEENGKREKDIRFIEFKKNIKKTTASKATEHQPSLKNQSSELQGYTETDLNKVDQGEQ